jgi:hypothetical protein
MLSGILAAVRAFVRALRNGPPSRRRALPAAPSQPPAELPAAYEGSKVALIAVNPYLVHAYWDVDTSRLPPGTKCAVLRFHDVSEAAPGPPFDVDIDLRAPNWYVHLWSPAKSYYAALAVKTERGEFIPLATSNRVETPRAWPAAPQQSRDEQAGSAGGIAPRAERDRQAKAPAPPSLGAGSRAEEGTRPTRPAPAPAVTSPVHADEILRQRLAQIYALRSFEPRAAKAVAAAASITVEASAPVSVSRAAAAPTPDRSDLTSLAERQFSPGVPSSQS